MDFAQRLEACLKIETFCEEIYYALCKLFPEARELFRQLAEEEERHADILTISAEFYNIDAMSERIVPNSVAKIQESLDLADKMRREIAVKTISLHEALEMALELEESVAEMYFNELMTDTSDEEIISHLQQYYKDEMKHTHRIRQYMLEKGL